MTIQCSNLIKLAGLGLATGLLSGCAGFFSYGETEYGCPGMEQGVRCMSVTDVYDRTHDRDSLSIPPNAYVTKRGWFFRKVRKLDPTKLQENPEEGGVALRATEAELNQRFMDTYVAPKLPDGNIPIRTPAKVMRIWVNSWEDTSGDFHMSGLMYTEIEQRRWVLGDEGRAAVQVVSPLTN